MEKKVEREFVEHTVLELLVVVEVKCEVLFEIDLSQ